MSKTARVARLLDLPGIGAVLDRAAAWRGVLVLCYHRIGDPSGSPWDRALYSATPEAFDAQVRHLAATCDVVGPREVPALSRARGRHVLITFDDGYRDNHVHALPILRSHGVAAAFFLVPGFIDRPRVPWWDEVAWMVRRSERPGIPAGGPLGAPVHFDEPNREEAIAVLLGAYKALPGEQGEALLDHIAEAGGTGRADPSEARTTWVTWGMARDLCDAGMHVGGHTVDHPVLARLPRAAQAEQVAGCARRLGEELGLSMRWFSYPVGLRDAFDGDTRACLEEQGVELAFSLYGGVAGGRIDRLDVPRTSIGWGTTHGMFRSTLRAPALLARW